MSVLIIYLVVSVAALPFVLALFGLQNDRTGA